MIFSDFLEVETDPEFQFESAESLHAEVLGEGATATPMPPSAMGVIFPPGRATRAPVLGCHFIFSAFCCLSVSSKI